jgi:hypothetical protein
MQRTAMDLVTQPHFVEGHLSSRLQCNADTHLYICNAATSSNDVQPLSEQAEAVSNASASQYLNAQRHPDHLQL